ncbi:hypothetical protein DFH94DRAFT_715506 [Russula ochroleuca]|uniref:NADP-dependent oxidoreductase domain-containing protein n=1 Tax=Russula ochroleuca TaxID=152965 RepID=A0A9P5TC70_9AGAM|nr:hypothetical protein DFH94DRAFT_715506 [Russula ochroleuca]
MHICLDPFFSLMPNSFNSMCGKEPAQILIRWSLQRGFVPLPKTENPDRVRSNIDVFGFEISKEDIDKLDELDRDKEGGLLHGIPSTSTWTSIKVVILSYRYPTTWTQMLAGRTLYNVPHLTYGSLSYQPVF